MTESERPASVAGSADDAVVAPPASSTVPGGFGTGLKPLQAIVAIGMIAIAVSGYGALVRLAGVSEPYIGFFFAFYLTGVAGADPKHFAPAAFGSLFGLALGYLLHIAPVLTGSPDAGYALFVCCAVPVVFLQLIGRATIVINLATMLILTMATIPHIQAHASFGDLLVSLLLAILYLGVLIFGGRKIAAIAKRRQRPSAPSFAASRPLGTSEGAA